MKCTIPEISWHNREPVLSVDVNPVSTEIYRLATSGGDSHVLIWLMTLAENGSLKQELVTDLNRHQKAVNVVRWSPSGQYLASADDDANIIIWQQKTDNIPSLEGDTGDKETWIVHKILRGHKEDIYDLCWSVDGLKLLSGSIDNTAILWNVMKGKIDHILSDHKGFVQGVAWDTKDQLIATISTDRICRLFPTNGKYVKARIHKGRLPVSSDHFLYKKDVKLQFSPDGSLLVIPSGHIEAEDCKEVVNATLVFTLDNFNESPAAILPLKHHCSTVIRFCPILFKLHENGPEPIVNLPYRMIFAVSTDHDVILYDTQQSVPFARLQEIHYTRLTDLTWSNDGRLLIASSTDGFCALITFDLDELGVPFSKEEDGVNDNVVDVSRCEVSQREENEESDKAATSDKRKEKKRQSLIEQWTQSTSKRVKIDMESKKRGVKEVEGVTEIIDDESEKKCSVPAANKIRKDINILIPRRAPSSCNINY
ncbi:hypothetical protein NQ315_012702 [Exocentrus adspersus]|uniref:CAF1B/HIR1 beta-propeller domain-containing protein n=1 Tax=Exocentrus adspersus TaxID=1586481 RepID=A0AAV8VTI9_9CUCU|nr:hypothetical protein NQ315_012702 [Exocentrus adspersus]